MSDQEIWKLIQKYVTGLASEEENERLKSWLEQDSDNFNLVQELEDIWTASPDEESDINVQDAWDSFRRNRMKKDYPKVYEHPARKTTDNWIYIYRVAAIILVSLFTGYIVQHYVPASDAAQVADFPVMEDLVTGQGEKARVTFSDGTEVTLNSAGSLSFPEEFRNSQREVHLDGEAYFKVAHNPDQPFIVHTQGAEVKVLGTEFNVRGWAQDSSVEIAVREGKVSVISSDRQLDHDVILTAGYYTTVANGQNPAPAREVDVRNNLLWLRGGLHFDRVPFSQVIRDIERRFNVQITVADTKLFEGSFTSTFQYAELDEILSVIAAAIDVEYSRDGSMIEFI